MNMHSIQNEMCPSNTSNEKKKQKNHRKIKSTFSPSIHKNFGWLETRVGYIPELCNTIPVITFSTRQSDWKSFSRIKNLISTTPKLKIQQQQQLNCAIVFIMCSGNTNKLNMRGGWLLNNKKKQPNFENTHYFMCKMRRKLNYRFYLPCLQPKFVLFLLFEWGRNAYE